MSKTVPSKIYLVKDVAVVAGTQKEANEVLVRAKTRQGAVAIVASAHFKAELCSQDDLMRLVAKGETVVEALEEAD